MNTCIRTLNQAAALNPEHKIEMARREIRWNLNGACDTYEWRRRGLSHTFSRKQRRELEIKHHQSA